MFGQSIIDMQYCSDSRVDHTGLSVGNYLHSVSRWLLEARLLVINVLLRVNDSRAALLHCLRGDHKQNFVVATTEM